MASLNWVTSAGTLVQPGAQYLDFFPIFWDFFQKYLDFFFAEVGYFRWTSSPILGEPNFQREKKNKQDF